MTTPLITNNRSIDEFVYIKGEEEARHHCSAHMQGGTAVLLLLGFNLHIAIQTRKWLDYVKLFRKASQSEKSIL